MYHTFSLDWIEKKHTFRMLFVDSDTSRHSLARATGHYHTFEHFIDVIQSSLAIERIYVVITVLAHRLRISDLGQKF